eukprot:TRINITY_DN22056_c0_g2_i1.p1 TRINITY_DN22056_c0_g2~~TRINITY_DN22056_c0_g2_i1.p1  ORF type:complete len:111 (+),score=19.52 TRINITY_DN22056_c0_g2_i1:22-333(+)
MIQLQASPTGWSYGYTINATLRIYDKCSLPSTIGSLSRFVFIARSDICTLDEEYAAFQRSRSLALVVLDGGGFVDNDVKQGSQPMILFDPLNTQSLLTWLVGC